MENELIGLVVHAAGGTGVLHQMTGVIARHRGDIVSVEILDNTPEVARTYFEVALAGGPDALVQDLRALAIVRRVELVKTLQKIYGKRVIIMGGGAQVGQVAIGAVSEADRHNIRGEHISVDTIPLVGEQAVTSTVPMPATASSRIERWLAPLIRPPSESSRADQRQALARPASADNAQHSTGGHPKGSKKRRLFQSCLTRLLQSTHQSAAFHDVVSGAALGARLCRCGLAITTRTRSNSGSSKPSRA